VLAVFDDDDDDDVDDDDDDDDDDDNDTEDELPLSGPADYFQGKTYIRDNQTVE
jgi:hypothetical protein